MLHYYLSDYSSAEAALEAAQNLPSPAHKVQRDFLATEVALARRLAGTARARVDAERDWLGEAAADASVGQRRGEAPRPGVHPDPDLNLSAVHAVHDVRASIQEQSPAPPPGVMETLLADIAALDTGEVCGC